MDPSVAIREPAAAAKPQRSARAAARYQSFFFLLLGAALGFGLGFGLAGTTAPAAAAEPPTAAILSTPSTALSFELAAALRCDVALALGISPSLVLLTESVEVTGAAAAIAEGDAINTDASCGARALQAARSLPVACAVPLSQKLSSVKLSVRKAGAGAAAIGAVLAAMHFPSACGNDARPPPCLPAP